MLGTATGDTGRKNLATLGYIAPQHIRILVVWSKVLGTEFANLFSETGFASAPSSVSSVSSVIIHGIVIVIAHYMFLLATSSARRQSLRMGSGRRQTAQVRRYPRERRYPGELAVNHKTPGFSFVVVHSDERCFYHR
jgi:hypothetical protein